MNELAVTESRALTLLDEGRRALAEAKALAEVKVIRDQAQAIQDYLRQQRYGHEAQQDAAELKVRAERRLGELLAEIVVARGDHDKGTRGSIRTLPEGVDKHQSHRWQRIASLPEPAFEQHLAEARSNGREITTAAVMREAKRQTAATVADEATEDPRACVVGDLYELVKLGRRFACLYADPPWQYGNQATRGSTDTQYPTMPLEEIAALPVGELAADKAHLHLWTTNGFLREAFTLLDCWGFEYKSVFVWCKPQMGLGNYWRVSHEYLLLGTRGGLDFADHSLWSYGVFGRGEHSEKPAQVRHMIERATPGPRLELFGRDLIPGWCVWGNEVARDNMFVTVEEL